jgi:transglutaminase-like putative cysteine protease
MVVDAGTRGGIDRLVLSARWDQAVPMAVAGRNLPAPMTQAPGRVELVAQAPIAASSAGRMIEFSDFRQWSEVAGIFQPLFAQARQTGEGSPIRDEIARIRAEARDPVAQAGMALAVAQARVKYLYVGLGEGNLRPMPADQVWQRGFADCKGKAALLLAMLDGLGIAAEPALVATRGGEQLDRRLPNVTGFDHVIVRAEIGGRVFWLDPTQDAIAGGDLASRGAQQFGWALPVRLGAGLEAMTGVRAARRSGAAVRNP